MEWDGSFLCILIKVHVCVDLQMCAGNVIK